MSTRRSAIRLGLSTALALLAAGCAPGGDLPVLPDLRPAPYRLGVGDQVRIITFGETQLTGEFHVGDSGAVALPLLGRVPASGLTTDQLSASIVTELRGRNLFRDPSVTVEVLQYRPFFILGEVNRPGPYPYQPGMTVLAAVTVAGGFTYRAVKNEASIVRTMPDGHAVEGRVLRQSLIQPGDVITIFERLF